ncbi:MAG TPA: hypothetical protein DEA08_35225 [Planctomycetes bacterium]|nr:hypothetical protein [Planctomycetota bacterium]
MRRHVPLALLLLLAWIGPVCPQEGSDRPNASFSWETDLSRAQARARQERKPLLVVFRCDP